MSNTKIIVVTADPVVLEKAKKYWEESGCAVESYSPEKWDNSLELESFRSQLKIEPKLVVGNADVAKVIQFPPVNKISTMDEVEKQTIETAISQCRGNLTLAAKALGIGRATLYRKVKLYSIDTNVVRGKKAA